MRAIRLVVASLLVVIGVARAETLQVVDRRNPLDVVASSAIWGGMAGGAVGGALIGYQMGIQNQGSYSWMPVLATTVGIGLAAGTIWGMVQALSAPGPTLVNGPASDGMSMRDQRPHDLSGQTTLPFLAGRF